MNENMPNLIPSEIERLARILEEAGEVQMIVGKILRFGYHSYHPDDPDLDNRRLLEIEIGHFNEAVDEAIGAGDVSLVKIHNSFAEKKESVKPYLVHQGD